MCRACAARRYITSRLSPPAPGQGLKRSPAGASFGHLPSVAQGVAVPDRRCRRWPPADLCRGIAPTDPRARRMGTVDRSASVMADGRPPVTTRFAADQRQRNCQRLGLPSPTRFSVPANTLVAIDTCGFHARADADRPDAARGIVGLQPALAIPAVDRGRTSCRGARSPSVAPNGWRRPVDWLDARGWKVQHWRPALARAIRFSRRTESRREQDPEMRRSKGEAGRGRRHLVIGRKERGKEVRDALLRRDEQLRIGMVRNQRTNCARADRQAGRAGPARRTIPPTRVAFERRVSLIA